MIGGIFALALLFYAMVYSGVRRTQGVDVSILGALTGAPERVIKAPAPTTTKGAGAGMAGGKSALRAAKSGPSSTGTGCQRPNGLTTWKGVTLSGDAMRAFKAASKSLGAGTRIIVGSSYRTCGAQKSACDSICGNGCGGCPGLCAKCGESCHQRGDAIDVSNYNNPKVHRALIQAGFVHPLPGSDPVHYSLKRCGN